MPTEGSEAKISMVERMSRRMGAGATSTIKIETKMPSGALISNVTSAVSREPISSGNTPKSPTRSSAGALASALPVASAVVDDALHRLEFGAS